MHKASVLCACLAMAACVGPYVPPPANASTARLDVTIHNLFGQAVLDIGTGGLQKQNLLTTHTLGEAVGVKTLVKAPADVRMVYQETIGASQCNLQFKFPAAPAQTYQLFVGDVGPVPATTGLGKFGRWLFPMAGKGCFAKAWQTEPDGSLSLIPLEKAFY